MEWQKLIEVVIGLRDGFAHASAVVVLTFASVTWQDGKWKIDGKSKENLEKICGIQFFSLVFLSFWTVCAYPKLKQQQKIRFRRRLALFEQGKLAPLLGNKLVRFWRKISHRFWGNPSPTLGKSVTDFGEIRRRLWGNLPRNSGKSVTDFGEIRHRFWGNPSPTLGKSVTDFGEIRHRLWGNLPRISGKSVTDFGEIRHRFWGNPSPILGKSVTDFREISHRLWGNLSPTLRKSVTDFGKIRHRLLGNPSPVLWSSVTKWLRFGEKLRLARFLDWLGTKLKSHCFER